MKHFIITSIFCATVLLATVLPVLAQQPVSGGKAVNVNFGQIKSQIPSNFTDIASVIGRIFTVTITAAGGIFVIMLLFGGTEYLTGAGNEEATKKGKGRMIDASIGIVITLSAWAIGTFVLNQFYQGGSPRAGGAPGGAAVRPSDCPGTKPTPQAICVVASISERYQDRTVPSNGAVLSINLDDGSNRPKGQTRAGKLAFWIDQGRGSYQFQITKTGCTSLIETAQFGQGSFTRTINCAGQAPAR